MRSLAATLLITIPSLALAQTPGPNPNPSTHGYYRQPAIHGDTIVFVSEGDLWKVPVAGGSATRLTTGSGEESNPAISPDGKTIAFVGSYEGPGEIYTMPIDGGLPVRQTYGASRVTFVGWSPSGKVMYSTREFATLPSSQLVAFTPRVREADPVEAAAIERVPLYEADQGVYSDDGKTLFFTRLPFQGSNTKRYQGGFIQQLWKFGTGDAEATPLTTDYPGTSKDAMFWQGRVYFATDRDGIMNIWSMDQNGKDLKQHSKHTEYDVASPDLDNGRIVYQHGADIWLLDLASGNNTQIPIQISSDFDQMREDWIKEPAKAIASTSVSPNGDRVALTARGQVFVAPAKQGRFVDVTQKSGTRFRDATFLPDGKSLLAFSDASGEVEIWKLPANGVGEPTQITNDSEILRFSIIPSPDGKFIAHTDKNQKLFITDIESKTTKTIVQNKNGDIGDVSWSADSKWIAFAAPAANANGVINLYSVTTGQTTPITTDRFDSASPVFSPDGKWLYLLSDRNFQSTVQSPWGPLAPQPHFDKRTKVYVVALKKEQRSPWRPNDELNPGKKDDAKKEDKKEDKKDEKKDEAKSDGEKPADEKKDDKKAEKPAPEVIIDLDGIQSRLEEVPLPASNYGNLSITEKSLFFTDFTRGDTKTNLIGVNIGNEKIETKTVASDIRRYELSHDRKKLFIQKQGPGGPATLFIVDANVAPADFDGKSVDLTKWKFSLTPAIEWKQMYVDAWRLLRDFFYATNMHGVDWPAMKAKYAPLVDRVRTRAELNDILAQLSGELSTLHHFVRGGDIRDSADDIANAFLGAEMSREKSGWRVQHIFDFDPDEPGSVPPLARPGVDVGNGDLIEQINGISLANVADPSSLLRGKANQQVLLRVKPASGAESRDVIVTPISGNEAADLRYSSWEYTRRLEVEKKGNAEIGYVHLRNMGGGEIGRWAKNFFPVYNRAGLIIDVRRNTGGNIDSWILGALLRKAWMFWNARVGQPDTWNMQFAFRGHMVVLADAFTASDGEAFSEGFKRLGLGKVIGTRTWGGEVWLSMNNRLSDGGVASAGETGVFGPDGIWLVEGKGVVPDIEVDNLPHATFEGKDAQLEAAIAHLQQLIKEKPVLPPQTPALPDKSFKPAK
ncbi:MAG: PD40 domain-containing protein [Phycisphaeraceae bacterium]|nr:PD40 domain-containing protein [Phycisphaeraceae bacterium]